MKFPGLGLHHGRASPAEQPRGTDVDANLRATAAAPLRCGSGTVEAAGSRCERGANVGSPFGRESEGAKARGRALIQTVPASDVSSSVLKPVHAHPRVALPWNFPVGEQTAQRVAARE